jgi:hypothetical protein
MPGSNQGNAVKIGELQQNVMLVSNPGNAVNLEEFEDSVMPSSV